MINKSQWNILIVDDEKDVHTLTIQALSDKTWKDREFKMFSAYSAKQAMELFESGHKYDIAIVDVIMETKDAGLKLCHFIRDNCPRSLRIILRTGQPGTVPKIEILNNYDIDYYISKIEVDTEQLFSIIRACLRAHEDVSTIMAFSEQMRKYTAALGKLSHLNDMMVLMEEVLKFVSIKYYCECLFIPDLLETRLG